MSRRAHPDQPIEQLDVLLDDSVVAVLEPGCPTFVIGRGRQCDLRIGSSGSQGDRHISRTMASIRWRRGAWTVQNDSQKRPLDVVVDSAVVPLRPCVDDGGPATFVLGPRGATLRISSLSGTFDIQLQPTGAAPESAPIPAPDPLDPSTLRLRRPTPHDALLLAAKFLSRRHSGYAVGNEVAAERANAARGQGRTRITARAVENSVARWREQLQMIGIQNIDGRGNINQLGIELLKHGVISETDRLGPPIVERDVFEGDAVG
jgi:hypothetical protein